MTSKEISRFEFWFTVVLVCLILIIGAAMACAKHDCAAVGGTLVRGMFWYECIRD